MENKKFNYNGTPVTFLSGKGDVMVNATEMASAFNKQPSDWIRLKSTNEFLNVLEGRRGIPRGGMIRVVNDGLNNGTWLHEDVAIEFARWLSPDFAIWCNDRMKELLTHGFTTLDTISRKDLARMILESEEEKERLQLTVQSQAKQIENDAPRVLFSKAVETSQKSCLIGELAKILKQNGIDMGEKRLFAWMRDNGYICSRGDYRNRPTQKSMELGLFEIKKTVITKPNGEVLTTITPKVSGKGQIYFINKFLK